MKKEDLKENETENDQFRHDDQMSNSKYLSYLDSSSKFGQLLVTNLIIINAGALLVFPTFIEKLRNGTISNSSASMASILFVLGLVSAVLSGYAAYLNFMYLAQSTITRKNLRIFKHKCTPQMLEVPENKTVIIDLTDTETKHNKVVSFTVIAGNIFGLLSCGLFIVGCYFIKTAILGP